MTTNAHGGGGAPAAVATDSAACPQSIRGSWSALVLCALYFSSFLGLVNVRNRCEGWNALAMEHTHTHTHRRRRCVTFFLFCIFLFS